MSLTETLTDIKIIWTRKDRSYFMVIVLFYELGNDMKQQRTYPIPVATTLTLPLTSEHDSTVLRAHAVDKSHMCQVLHKPRRSWK